MSEISVCRMVSEKLFLFSERIIHRQIGVDILLTSIHDTDESKFEGVCPSSEDLERVGTGVHEVELGQYTDRAQASWIDCTGELERVRVCNVDVGG